LKTNQFKLDNQLSRNSGSKEKIPSRDQRAQNLNNKSFFNNKITNNKINTSIKLGNTHNPFTLAQSSIGVKHLSQSSLNIKSLKNSNCDNIQAAGNKSEIKQAKNSLSKIDLFRNAVEEQVNLDRRSMQSNKMSLKSLHKESKESDNKSI